MTAPDQHNIEPDGLLPQVPADQPADPARIAREQLVHGLLGFLHQDTRERQSQRVQRTIAALHAEGSGDTGSGPIPFPRAAMSSRWRSVLTAAAAVALTAVMIAYLVPTTPTAMAMVDSALAASSAAGDRRYEVRVAKPPRGPQSPARGTGPNSPATQPAPLPLTNTPDATRPAPPTADPAGGMLTLGVIDLRNADRMVVRARNPMGDRVAFGRDAGGSWSVRPEGPDGGPAQASRLSGTAGRPRWIELGESTILLDSTDALLAALKTEYDAKRADPAPLESAAPGVATGELFDRISATRKATRPGPEPQRIEVWISRATKLVQRIELHWPEFSGPPQGRPEGFGPREGGPRDGPPPRDGGPREGGRRPRFDGPPPDGFGPRGPGGHGGPAGPGPREGGPQQPGPHAEPGQPPRGPRPDGAGEPGRPRHHPRFLEGNPDFAHEHRPPPRKIVFDLVSTDTRKDDWFSPEAHTDWVSGRGQD